MSPDSNQVIVALWFRPIWLEAPKLKKPRCWGTGTSGSNLIYPDHSLKGLLLFCQYKESLWCSSPSFVAVRGKLKKSSAVSPKCCGVWGFCVWFLKVKIKQPPEPARCVQQLTVFAAVESSKTAFGHKWTFQSCQGGLICHHTKPSTLRITSLEIGRPQFW